MVSGRETLMALYRAGFTYASRDGSHVTVRHSVSKRKATVPDHGGEDMPTGTLRHILRDTCLSVEEFIALL